LIASCTLKLTIEEYPHLSSCQLELELELEQALELHLEQQTVPLELEPLEKVLLELEPLEQEPA
jgi:hypothetical protein